MIAGTRGWKTVLATAIVGVIVLCAPPSTALAEDIIKILDGGTIRGFIIEETDEHVLFRRKGGDVQEIPKDMIDYIRRGPAFEEEFKQKWDRLMAKGPDADSAFELGLWCEDRGHMKEADQCYELTIRHNPDHMIAREKLGHMQWEGKWHKTPEEYYKARGYVLYEGIWIPKQDKEKYEAGLVKLDDGTWVSKKKLEEMKKKKRMEASAPDKTRPGKKKPDKNKKNGKSKVWKRQKLDQEFYKDSSGSVPWASRKNVETKYYIIESNASKKHIKHYSKMLDMIFEKYVSVFKKAPSSKCKVRIYSSHQEFMNQEHKGGGVGGYYAPGRGLVVAYHGTFGKTGSTQTVIFHECTHQFHDMVAGIRNTQIWFIEGLATFFECSEIDEKGKIHIGVVNSLRFPTVKKETKSGRYITLDTLLRTQQSGYSGRHYAYGWSLIYFLVYTNKNNRKLFNRYWVDVANGRGEKPGSPEFKKMIGVPVQDLDDCWKEWIQVLDKDDLPEEVQTKSKDFLKDYSKRKKKKKK